MGGGDAPRWAVFPAGYVEESAPPNEAEVPTPLHPVGATSNPVTFCACRRRNRARKKKRKGKGGDDDDLKFSSTALQPASNARRPSAPHNKFLLLGTKAMID